MDGKDAHPLPIWFTVQVDLREKELKALIKQYKHRARRGRSAIAPGAFDVLCRLETFQPPRSYTLSLVTGARLGLAGSYTRAALYAAAEARGLRPCPPELGLLLVERHQTRFPRDAWVTLGMTPAPDSFGDDMLFHVSVDEERVCGISVGSGHPQTTFNAQTIWLWWNPAAD